MTMLAACMFTACSNSDDNEGDNNSANLYAIIKPEGAQLIDIVPSDYVLTLDNIIAVNPETNGLTRKPILYQLSTSSCSILTVVSCLMPN